MFGLVGLSMHPQGHEDPGLNKGEDNGRAPVRLPHLVPFEEKKKVVTPVKENQTRRGVVWGTEGGRTSDAI